MIPYPDGTACIPGIPHERVVWKPGLHSGGDLRVVVDNRVVQVIESTACSCAVFADPSTLVTGSRDHTVRLWRVQRLGQTANAHKEPPLSITLTHVMRAHTSAVTCVIASRAWSVVVSGSKDGSAAFWDLNRGTYVRSIWHDQDGSGVHLVSVNESTVGAVGYHFTFKLRWIVQGPCCVVFEVKALASYHQRPANCLTRPRVLHST